MSRSRFLCDSCKYDYDGACTRPERPNAVRCPDYTPKGKTVVSAARGRKGAALSSAFSGILKGFRKPLTALRLKLPSRTRRASTAVDALLNELEIPVAPESGDPEQGESPQSTQGGRTHKQSAKAREASASKSPARRLAALFILLAVIIGVVVLFIG